MQVTIFNDRLNKALSLVSRIVSSRGQLPILSNVLLNAEEGNLFLTTTNLEIAITTKITAFIQKIGKTTVPVKQFYELTSLIKEEKIELLKEGNNFIIKGKKTKNTLNTTEVSEFPQVLKKEGLPDLIIKEKEFSRAINQIAIATSQDESRPILGGVLLTKKEKGIEIAATDGYRLSTGEISSEKNEMEKTYIFPIRTLLEVMKIAKEEKSKEIRILIIKDQNQVVFLFEDNEIVSRIIDGEFPDFQKIVPVSFTTQAIIDKEELINSVKLAAVFARESANIIKFKIKAKELTLSANAPSVGENSTSLEIDCQGDDLEIAFNYRFLLDFLQVCEGERVVFETNGALNPGVFKTEKPGFIHIIMPVRIQA